VIQVPDPGADWILNITSDITLETWIKRDTDQSGQQVIVGAVSTPGQNVPDAGGNVYIAGLLPPQQFFDGFIDEVSIYSRALATSEIREIYTRGTLGKCK
jgi:hypothetical protein